MKLIISTFLIFLISLKSFGQLNYGIKAGISLNASGDITSASSDLSSLALINENKNGYFFGGYASLKLLFLYLRPELQFSYLNSTFESISLSQSKLEAPISLGFKLLPIISIFSGPTLQYNFEPEIENFSLSAIEQKTSLGIHFGLRAHLGPLNADLRFDRGINENELSLLEQNGVPVSGRIDTRSNVWSIGLSYKL